MAQRAGASGRDHVAADVVAIPSQQDFLLGADHHGAAARPGGVEATRQKSQRRGNRRAVPAGPAFDRHDAQGTAPELGMVCPVSGPRRRAAGDRAVVSQETARAGDRCRHCLCGGAAERRGWIGRDLPANGKCGDDVRRARQGRRLSAARPDAQRARPPAGDRRKRGLLPALRLAGVGHLADLPCP